MKVDAGTPAIPEFVPTEPAPRCVAEPARGATCSVEPAPASRAEKASPPPESKLSEHEQKALEAMANACRARDGVELCKRTADLPVARELELQHHWLRTGTKEAGMGAVDEGVPGERIDLPFVTQTSVNDHSGQGDRPGSTCTQVPNVDEACVNRELELGKRTGRWTPLNQCQSYVSDVLEKCAVKDAGSR